MPLPLPNLDDRDFERLLSDAKARIRRNHPAWTDLSPHDPGMVLLDAFAHLTDLLLYRLNRVPDKIYIALLRLIGVELHAPRAAVTELTFSRARAVDQATVIPQGTRVAGSRGGPGEQPPVFTLARDVEIAAGEQATTGTAYHAESVSGDLVGRGTGQPGLQMRVLRPPIVARTEDLDVVVGVEMTDEEDATTIPSRAVGDKRFRLWREVDDFARYSGDDPYVFTVDRVDGVVRFAPAVAGFRREDEAPRAAISDDDRGVSKPLGAVPPHGREIRVWYWRGGGANGNVPADSLSTLKDPIAGVKSTNPKPATAGRDIEELDNALIRGPLELFSLDRAVTAQDFETLAVRAGVARSLAFASIEMWAHARPGSVDIVLVPELAKNTPATLANLVGAQGEEVRRQVLATLEGRQPIGTQCRANWARYKPVQVKARVVVNRAESGAEVRQRVLERLKATINPLPRTPNHAGWRFGEALRASHIYEAILAVPGVRYANEVELVVEDMPESGVTCLFRHPLQNDTWFSAANGRLFRSQNNGESWELIRAFEGQKIAAAAAHEAPEYAGLLAVATNSGEDGDGDAQVFVSNDSGETWSEHVFEESLRALLQDHEVRDLTWTVQDGKPVLFVATDRGLYRVFVSSSAGPELIVVDHGNDKLGIDAVVAIDTATGDHFVAVAAENVANVYISTVGGKSRSFLDTELRNVDVKTLHAQYDGLRNFLWAGARLPGSERPSPGCYVTELSKANGTAPWRPMNAGWRALSCHAIDSRGSYVFAASHDQGVLRLDVREEQPQWTSTLVNGGLPLDPNTGRLQPVMAIAAGAKRDGENLVLAGGPGGIFASSSGTGDYKPSSQRRFDETVKIPSNWLLCSADHDIRVEVDDDAE